MRRILTTLLVAGGLVLAGCAAPVPPEVTFFANGTDVNASPFQRCDIRGDNCLEQPRAIVRLTPAGGQPIQISVPGEVAESRWAVVVQFATAAGEQPPETLAMFKEGESHAYTVRMDPGKILRTVEVKQAAHAIVQHEDGDLQLAVRTTWSLQVSNP